MFINAYFIKDTRIKFIDFCFQLTSSYSLIFQKQKHFKKWETEITQNILWLNIDKILTVCKMCDCFCHVIDTQILKVGNHRYTLAATAVALGYFVVLLCNVAWMVHSCAKLNS